MVEQIINSAMPRIAFQAQEARNYFRRLAFVLIGVFILCAPSVPQVLGLYSVYYRPWTMFSGVGVGLLKGEFIEYAAAGEVSRYEPPKVLGQKQYSRAMISPHAYLVLSDAHLAPAVAPFCKTLTEGARLAFEGYRQTKGGWVAVASDNVCEAG